MTRKLSRRGLIATLGTAGALGLTGCAGSNATSSTPTSLSLLLDWQANATHAGHFVAKERGFYEDRGLSVDISPGEGGGSTAKQVGAEKYTLGLTSAASVLQTRSEDLAVKSYAASQQGPNSVVFTVAEEFGGTLEDPAQLADRTIAVVPSSSNLALLERILQRHGVRESVDFLQVGYGGLQSSLISGNADASLGAFPDGIALGREGYDSSMLWLSDYVATTGRLVVANPSVASENEQALGDYLRATARGWAWAGNNPEAAMDHLIDAEPRLEETRSLGIQKIKGTVAKLILTATVREHGWGWQTAESWTTVADALAKGDFIDSARSTESAWTNEFLDQSAEYVGSFAANVSAEYDLAWLNRND